MSKPPLCPRCGNDVFTTTVAYGEDRAMEMTFRCSECELTYDDKDETWRDERGEEWTMSEAGE